MRREINLSFLGHQVHVGEHNDTDNGLFGNLRAPAGFRAGVIALAFLEPEFQQELDEIDEMFARAAERMMVVIAPAEPKLVLPALLDLSGAITAFPISALGCEEEFAREIAADKLEAVVDDARDRWRFLSEDQARRLVGAYGSNVKAVLGDARDRGDLGPAFGPELTGAEVRYLMTTEWARFPDDILWRRSKLGLTMEAGDREALAAFMASG